MGEGNYWYLVMSAGFSTSIKSSYILFLTKMQKRQTPRNGFALLNRVPSGKDVSVVINVPEAEMSLVTRSKTSFRPAVMDSRLKGNRKISLSC